MPRIHPKEPRVDRTQRLIHDLSYSSILETALLTQASGFLTYEIDFHVNKGYIFVGIMGEARSTHFLHVPQQQAKSAL
jgi:hypothetical protein